MKVYHSIEDFPSEINTIITIGTFDGVHKGHKQVIKKLNNIAKKNVATFPCKFRTIFTYCKNYATFSHVVF